MKLIFQEVIMRKNKGFTLIEVMVVLFINVMLVMLITTTLPLFKKKYNNYSPALISSHEALMFIDYYINCVGEEFYVADGKIYILSSSGKKCDYIAKRDSEIGIFYMNKEEEEGVTYTYQPILYNVNQFIIFQNKEVLHIKIITKDKREVKKTVGNY